MYLEEKLNFMRIFNKDAQLPKTPEECKSWFIQLTGELSPENLCCDGELSRSQVRPKLARIQKEWQELEEIFGRKVSEEEAEMWSFEEFRRTK